jgi:hypothetical protein
MMFNSKHVFVWYDRPMTNFGLNIRGYGIQIKGPRARKTFSERYGYTKFHAIGRGWRWRFYKPEQM